VLTKKYLGLETADLFSREDRIFFERVRADLHHIPLANGWADVVFSYASLHHSHDLPALYEVVDRVLRPGGHLIFLSEPSKRESIEENQPENAETEHGINEYIYSYAEWLQPLRKRGFRVRRLVPRSIRHHLVNHRPAYYMAIPRLLRPLTWTERRRDLLERLQGGFLTGRLLYRYWSLPLTLIAQKPTRSTA